MLLNSYKYLQAISKIFFTSKGETISQNNVQKIYFLERLLFLGGSMEDIGFEEQLKQEEIQKLKEEESRDKTYKDKDGTEYEWDEAKKAWFPKISEDFIAQYQMTYGAHSADPQNGDQQSADQNQEEDGDESEDKGAPSLEGLDVNSEEYAKRYHEYYAYYYGEDYANYYSYYNQEEVQGEVQAEGQGESESQDGNQKGKKRKKKGEKPDPPPKREEGWFEVEEDKNTNVYVSGLPSDVTEEEFKTLMNRCGLVMFDPVMKQPKLKLYLNEHGNPKGDGRCCYIKTESVELALKFLDGSDVRGSTIHVERAQFALKGQFDPTKKKKKLSNKQKRKFLEKQKKLFDWRPEKKLEPATRPKNEKVVVLKNMFSPKEFEVDPLEVKNIRLYDNHPDGVITVTMKTPCEADEVIKLLNGRWFAKKKITAETWDGKTKYDIEESEAERDERLKKWGEFLEKDEQSQSRNNLTNTSAESADSKAPGDSSQKIQISKDSLTSIADVEKGDNSSLTNAVDI
ncbi:HTATSF1 [Mytilus edulis]|uniref:HTATSF1 n=1 Tax=Mytilus edulis TaxID=6550 RepID=A0A8S3SXP6_MYTED|nr:HTATSF1 [Mytilus edulis]